MYHIQQNTITYKLLNKVPFLKLQSNLNKLVILAGSNTIQSFKTLYKLSCFHYYLYDTPFIIYFMLK